MRRKASRLLIFHFAAPRAWMRECRLPEAPTSPGLPEPATCWPARNTAYRFPAPWRTLLYWHLGSDVEAFQAYARSFPDNCIFLIDTHDVIAGARSAVEVALNMAREGHLLKGVRIDSGEMVAVSKKVRRILNEAGLHQVQIVGTSGFDEFEIEKALSGGAAIDAFGVGTRLGVSADTPYLDMVYKLARYDDRDVKKTSPGKITLAGEKQVFRKTDQTGRYVSDILGTRNEMIDETEPLLIKVMENGLRIQTPPSLQELRKRIQTGFSKSG